MRSFCVVGKFYGRQQVDYKERKKRVVDCCIVKLAAATIRTSRVTMIDRMKTRGGMLTGVAGPEILGESFFFFFYLLMIPIVCGGLQPGSAARQKGPSPRNGALFSAVQFFTRRRLWKEKEKKTEKSHSPQHMYVMSCILRGTGWAGASSSSPLLSK